jgi:outer membrane lipoprotein SlyB
MRTILFLICVLALPCASWGQADRASWANLSALQAGQEIQIVEMNATKHSGIFVNVSDAAISCQEAAGNQTIQKQDVRSVRVTDNKHRLRNTLIGAVAGAGAGAGVAAASWENRGFLGGKGVGAEVGAVIGGVVGAVVGVLLPSHSTIYRVNSH